VIGALAIATGLLAILDDDDGAPDLDELFQRAVVFKNKGILFDHLTKQQQRQFTGRLLDQFDAAPVDQKEDWLHAIRLFAPLWHWESFGPGGLTSPSFERSILRARKAYNWARETKVGFAMALHGYDVSDEERPILGDIQLDEPILVRIVETKDSDIIRRDAKHINPYWNVVPIEKLPKNDMYGNPIGNGIKFFWIWGQSVPLPTGGGGP
jgi:hypothetical protein